MAEAIGHLIGLGIVVMVVVAAIGAGLLMAAKLVGLSLRRTGHFPAYPYVPREPFLSAAERSFYGVLCAAMPEDRIVLAKVRLADIIQVQRGIPRRQFWRYFNAISGKHVDFVICDRATMDVVLCVELDDSSHQGRRRQQRDEFVNRALEEAEVPIARVPCKAAYTAADVQALK